MGRDGLTANVTIIRGQIADVNRQIMQLEPVVKMKNPNYEPPTLVVPPSKAANDGQINVGKF